MPLCVRGVEWGVGWVVNTATCARSAVANDDNATIVASLQGPQRASADKSRLECCWKTPGVNIMMTDVAGKELAQAVWDLALKVEEGEPRKNRKGRREKTRGEGGRGGHTDG